MILTKRKKKLIKRELIRMEVNGKVKRKKIIEKSSGLIVKSKTKNKLIKIFT